MNHRTTFLSAVLTLAFGLGHVDVEAQTIVTVDETNANWGFLDESSVMPSTVTSDLVIGPATPPRGSGSLHLALGAMTDGVIIVTQNHVGTRLADITMLSYSTYQNITPQALALQFNVDYDDTDGDTTTWQGRLVFEPLNAGTVMANTWQSWNAMTGSWWSSGTPIVGGSAMAQVCTQGSPCTWATVLTTYPDIAIHNLPLGAILFKAGSGWPAGFDGHADELHIQTAGFNVIYDFETIVPVELQTFTIE